MGEKVVNAMKSEGRNPKSEGSPNSENQVDIWMAMQAFGIRASDFGFRPSALNTMHLSPRELDKLTLHQAGFLAQKRLARGVRLNHPESVALIATVLLEFIRDGDPNASIPTPQPVFMRPMFGAFGSAPGSTSLAFVSQLCKEKGMAADYGLNKRIEAVRDCRNLGKRQMKWNDAMPKISVDPETYEVRADGELLVCEPAKVLPMAQRYFLF